MNKYEMFLYLLPFIPFIIGIIYVIYSIINLIIFNYNNSYKKRFFNLVRDQIKKLKLTDKEVELLTVECAQYFDVNEVTYTNMYTYLLYKENEIKERFKK